MGIDKKVVVDERGRITIPQETREKLNLYPGTMLYLKIEDGKLIIRKALSREDFVDQLCGIISVPEDDDIELKNIWTENLQE